jgi:hypothetical protein
MPFRKPVILDQRTPDDEYPLGLVEFDAMLDKQRSAQNSVVLARAVLGDLELLHVLERFDGRTNDAETRREMVDAVREAVAAKMRQAASK